MFTSAGAIPQSTPAMISRLFLSFILSACSLAAAETAAGFDLQAAINALPPTGGVVRIPAGTYEINTPIMLGTGDVRIEGAGAATHIVNRNTARSARADHSSSGIWEDPRDAKARLWRVTLANFRVSGIERERRRHSRRRR